MQSICTPNSSASIWGLTAAGCWARTISGLTLQGSVTSSTLPCPAPSLPTHPCPSVQPLKYPWALPEHRAALWLSRWLRILNAHLEFLIICAFSLPWAAPGQLHHSPATKRCTHKAEPSRYLKPWNIQHFPGQFIIQLLRNDNLSLLLNPHCPPLYRACLTVLLSSTHQLWELQLSLSRHSSDERFVQSFLSCGPSGPEWLRKLRSVPVVS